MVAFAENVQLWKNRVIPYEIESKFDYSGVVREAMNKWEAACGVTFVRRTNEHVNYVIVKASYGNRRRGPLISDIGMKGGAQDCYVYGPEDALHQLGHTLGMINEQCRSNRDEHVTVQWQNLLDGKSNPQFLIQASQNETEYDKESVMHYPSPSTGQNWQGVPPTQQVRTMLATIDPDKKLGPLSLTELSNSDKNGTRAAYDKVPAPIGPVTQTDSWKNGYAAMFAFSIDDRSYIYGQNLIKREYFTQEILPGGKMGSQIEWGTWFRAWKIQFSYNIDNRTFWYGHDQSTMKWFIQELLAGGKLGKETQTDVWDMAYDVQVPFAIGKKQFMFSHNEAKNYWFIQELLPGGKMGGRIDSGYWNNPYSPQFVYSIGGSQYVYGQNMKTKDWFAQQILPDGKMSQEPRKGRWNYSYNIQFAYSIGTKQYLFAHDPSDFSRQYFIRRINADGTFGDELQSGIRSLVHHVQFPLSVQGRQYWFGHNTDNFGWSIQELRDVA
ncbi:hypothetical protein NM208_g6065 [Fusarium decemcellulare]|uniref:Uncharacterized protein n=1 Tax=Fusarium decemcellulare TaxID=57161 RepID=A0ACC1SEK0_9HYPO|nr:hypothetical protein NM208_g6065 [Fusarium decemcellulare]